MFIEINSTHIISVITFTNLNSNITDLL